MMRTLKEQKKILGEKDLDEIRERTLDPKPGEFPFPRVEWDKSRKDVLRLLDYVDHLQREAVSLRRSII
jgi:hypothetical protein